MVDNLDKEQEKELIERAKSDPEAFGKLYDIYFDKLYGYIAYLVGNRTEAEDIVSETFEKAMINLEKFEWRGFAFSSWLFRIARNLVYDKSKAKSRISFSELEYVSVASGSDMEQEVEDKINSEELLECMEELPAGQREVLLLRYIQGYSLQETCEITGKSLDSVKSLAKRGLERLRERLDILSSSRILSEVEGIRDLTK